MKSADHKVTSLVIDPRRLLCFDEFLIGNNPQHPEKERERPNNRFGLVSDLSVRKEKNHPRHETGGRKWE